MRWLQGIHYRNSWFYDAQNKIKLGRDHDLRFKIASAYIKPGESVMDLCSGLGQLQEHLPSRCDYRCIEASPEFTAIMRKKNIPVRIRNLHEPLNIEGERVDTAVMIVSLCHFRDTRADQILEELKKVAGKVVIVEDVLAHPRGPRSFLYRAMNYLCKADYYRPIDLYTEEEFTRLMKRHGYRLSRFNSRYMVGFYGPIDFWPDR